MFKNKHSKLYNYCEPERTSCYSLKKLYTKLFKKNETQPRAYILVASRAFLLLFILLLSKKILPRNSSNN